MNDKLEPILDGIETIMAPLESIYAVSRFSEAQLQDLRMVRRFLASYTGSADTFTAYRRDLERFLLWLWRVQNLSLPQLGREHAVAFLEFIKKPPLEWIGESVVARYINQDINCPNPKWRPFSSRGADKRDYSVSQATIRAIMASMSTCLTFLVQEQYLAQNVMLLVRQKSRFLQKEAEQIITRKLSSTQWRYVIDTAHALADKDEKFERHLFVLSAFFLLGLRISELAVTERSIPLMSNFYADSNGRYWYKTVGKGNKYREVAVPDQMLQALSRYRLSRDLSPYPLKAESTLLLPKLKGRGGIGTRQIRNLVQDVFDCAIARLNRDNQAQLAAELQMATVHWLRHTSISFDVMSRPTEHVRDDAGHENITITDRYIEVERIRRHDSARGKELYPEEGF